MPTCKNCISKDVCQYKAYQEAVASGKDTSKLICIDNNVACKFFKDANCYVRVPCKVGDTVYFIDDDYRRSAEIDVIRIDEQGVHLGWAQYDRGPDITELFDEGEFDIEEIGKTVFTDFDEYEKALAEYEKLAEGACYNA